MVIFWTSDVFELLGIIIHARIENLHSQTCIDIDTYNIIYTNTRHHCLPMQIIFSCFVKFTETKRLRWKCHMNALRSFRLNWMFWTNFTRTSTVFVMLIVEKVDETGRVSELTLLNLIFVDWSWVSFDIWRLQLTFKASTARCYKVTFPYFWLQFCSNIF